MSADDASSDRHHFHYLSDPPGSFVLIAPSETAKRAVVFVHGFGGDAAGTWSHFQQFVDDLDKFREQFATVDLYFIQYQAVWESINSSVDRLGKFISNVVFDPESPQFQVPLGPLQPGIEPPTRDDAEPTGDGKTNDDGRNGVLLARPPGHRYDSLVIAAHSEGGVVVRQLILREYEAKAYSPLWDAKLALFAPALFGYEPSGLLGTMMNFPGLGRVIDACLRSSPAYRDLQLNSKAQLLAKLQSNTEPLQDVAAGFVASLLWGRRDRILQDGHYKKDPIEYKEDLGHVAICKPTVDYDDPISIIASKLP